MCISPITLKSRTRLTYSSRPTKTVPCGKCVECLNTRVNSWAFRLLEELKVSSSAVFLSLTYDDDHLPLADVTNHYTNYETGEITEYHYKNVPVLNKKDYQLFFKRLRKTTSNKLKYYACGEYGSSTHRPHYHAIIFNLPQSSLKNPSIIEKAWGNGYVGFGDCNIATIKYTCKYIMKGLKRKNTTRPPEFALMSKKMGLAHLTPQMLKYYKNHMTNAVTLPGGAKTPLPRYFRDKVFDKVENHKIKIEYITNQEEKFKSPHHEHEYKLNLIRIQNKINNLKRQKL